VVVLAPQVAGTTRCSAALVRLADGYARDMDNKDQIKGRVKEAAGDLTDNDKLKREGKVDQAAGRAKEVVTDIRDKAEDAVDKLKDRIHEVSRDR